MKIHRIEVANFKLLKNIAISFSTDPKKPLTSIRAENGSGKTSLLLAMLWAFYGRAGLPKHAANMRLSATSNPYGEAVLVYVMIEFEHEGHGGRSRYRLVRSCEETPVEADKVSNGQERLQVYILTDAGESSIPQPDTFLRQVVPSNLREVFFTNGDDVQEFMSGRVDRINRQGRVHDAIKSLLGLEQLYIARKDIIAADRRFRTKLSSESDGSEFADASTALNQAEDNLESRKEEIKRVETEIEQINAKKEKWEAELRSITDIGDLNQINSALSDCERKLKAAQANRDDALLGARSELSAEAMSWSMMSDALNNGIDLLSELADRGIIPGTSIEVVRDRLDEGICLCGTALPKGSDARQLLEHLIEEHQRVDQSQELLTAVHHGARFHKSSYDAMVDDGKSFADRRIYHLSQITRAVDQIRLLNDQKTHLIERREQIDEARVSSLTGDIKAANNALLERDRSLAVLKSQLDEFHTKIKECQERLRRYERTELLNSSLRANATVAGDLKQLVDDVIHNLEGDQVQQVACLMSSRFLEIVGSDPSLDAAVFGSVKINQNFDIEVRTPAGQRLDFDSDINGASQRALTLSFIWALMEVAGVEAPRIIDTPLGMVAGAVKTRLTEAITSPPASDGPNYQVVLLLTRSEIRDVEDLLDSRAGIVCTMTCSKDAKDLSYPWGQDEPQVKICHCSHRQSCRICARTYDDEGIFFQQLEDCVK
ncbi:AAA family ATPase [Vulcanococcus limneticus]|uniref:AAA family ATPase n=1 Tax=Vulcanococcus limneticus TaxID=2170428 RepID=UPI00398C2166